jgi:hypothetical protein
MPGAIAATGDCAGGGTRTRAGCGGGAGVTGETPLLQSSSGFSLRSATITGTVRSRPSRFSVM